MDDSEDYNFEQNEKATRPTEVQFLIPRTKIYGGQKGDGEEQHGTTFTMGTA